LNYQGENKPLPEFEQLPALPDPPQSLVLLHDRLFPLQVALVVPLVDGGAGEAH
jgi:hypothetical protein